MKFVFAVLVCFICGLSLVNAIILGSVSEAEARFLIGKAEQCFDADFVYYEEVYCYDGVPMIEKRLKEFEKLNKSEDLVRRDYDSKGQLISPERVLTDGLLNDKSIDDGVRSAYFSLSVGEDGMEFIMDKIMFKRVIKLKVTKVLKGDNKIGDVKQIEVYHYPGIMYPIYGSLGNIKKAQRYFLISKEWNKLNKYYFRYQDISAADLGSVPEAETEIITNKAEQCFDAEFVSYEKVYYYDGEPMSDKRFGEYKKWDDVSNEDLFQRNYNSKGKLISGQAVLGELLTGPNDDPFAEVCDYFSLSLGEGGVEFIYDKIMVKKVLKLKVTKVFKGGDKIGDVKQIDVFDHPDSLSPHFDSLGNYEEAQRYFVISAKESSVNKHDYRYQDLKSKLQTIELKF